MSELKRIDLNINKVKNSLPKKENLHPDVGEDKIKFHQDRIKSQLIGQLGAQTFSKIINMDNPVQLQVTGQDVDGEYQVEVKAWEVLEVD